MQHISSKFKHTFTYFLWLLILKTGTMQNFTNAWGGRQFPYFAKMADSVKKLFEDKSNRFFQFNFECLLWNTLWAFFQLDSEKVNVIYLILDIDSNTRHVSIVISPLKSLMIDQYQHNLRHGISAAVIKREKRCLHTRYLFKYRNVLNYNQVHILTVIELSIPPWNDWEIQEWP